MYIKPQIRQIGFDDGFFVKGGDSTILVGTVVRGNSLVEGFVTDRIKVDGDDATPVLSRIILSSKFYDTINVIFLKGITLAGFNVVDIQELNEQTGIPVIVVMRRLPDMNAITRALLHVENSHLKLDKLKKAGEIHRVPRSRGRLFFQASGIPDGEAIDIIKMSIQTGNIPESLRISHLVASAVTLGESRRRP